jgi:hypothetical protein
MNRVENTRRLLLAVREENARRQAVQGGTTSHTLHQPPHTQPQPFATHFPRSPAKPAQAPAPTDPAQFAAGRDAFRASLAQARELVRTHSARGALAAPTSQSPEEGYTTPVESQSGTTGAAATYHPRLALESASAPDRPHPTLSVASGYEAEVAALPSRPLLRPEELRALYDAQLVRQRQAAAATTSSSKPMGFMAKANALLNKGPDAAGGAMMLAPDADTTPRGVWHAIAQMEGLQLPDVVGIVQLVEEELSSARDMVRSLEAALTAAKRRRRSTAVSVPAAISSRRATAPEAAAHAELSAVAAARTPHRAQRDHVDRGPMYDDRVARSDVLQQVASSHRQEAAEPDHQMAQEQSAPPSATVDSMFRLLSQPQFCLPATRRLAAQRSCAARTRCSSRRVERVVRLTDQSDAQTTPAN